MKNAAQGPNLWFSCSCVLENAAIGNKFFFFEIFFFLNTFLPNTKPVIPTHSKQNKFPTNWNQQNKLPMLNNSQPIANKQNKFIAKRLT